MDKRPTIDENELFTRNVFKKVFSSTDGRMVLERLLIELGLFEQANTDTQIALKNFAVHIMELMGIYHESNTSQLVDLLLKTKTPEQTEIKNVRSNGV